jgi:hypothetical protein
MAPPQKSMTTLHDYSNIIGEHAATFKGKIYEICAYHGTILPKGNKTHALDLLWLEEKC